jgi:hypothetical protein
MATLFLTTLVTASHIDHFASKTQMSMMCTMIAAENWSI